MELHIEADEVAAVLLADGWHEVLNGFKLGRCQFVDGQGNCIAIDGGYGFSFIDRETKATVMGPMGSLLAVRPM
jgi:hypothetical protein